MRVWHVDKAELVRLLCLGGHEAPVCALAFSHDGALLASAADDGAVCVWRLASGAHLRTLRAHKGPAWCLDFSQENSLLLSAGADASMALWDVAAATSDAAAAGEEPFLLRRLHTKFTALHAARFSRANLVLAAGPYAPPADK